MVRHMISSTQAGLEDLSFKEDHTKHMPSQIGVDCKQQDFIRYRIGRYKLSEGNKQKSANCNSCYGVWLPKLLSGIFRQTSWKKTEEDEEKKNKWIGFHCLISEESELQKSLQRYSVYSVWLQNLLARSREAAGSPNTEHLDEEETDSKWIDPIDVIAHKTVKHVGIVSKASKALKSFNAALNLYKSFVRPMVELSLPVTSPYKITDLAHNSGIAQSKILESISDAGMTETNETGEDGYKLASEFVLLYKMLNGLANSSSLMSKINAVPSFRPLIFHNHLFSHRYRGTKYPEEGLALFILLKVTPHQFSSFQKYCCSKATDSIDTLDT
uniref:Uncharacterized protein n=1 Tax=Lygus hesperus TaxID=30085 RepID=A0A0A9YLK8_LYGHE